MNEDRIMSVGMEYARLVLSKWAEIIVMREEYRLNYLNGRKDVNFHNTYVTKLTSLYMELYPKIKDRTTFNNENPKEGEILFTDKYEEFRKYYMNPKLFATEGGGKKIFELEEVLAIALEKLRLLNFEGV